MSNTLRNTHQPDPQSLTEALSPTLKAEGYERRPIEERAMEIAKQTGAVHVEDLTKEGYPLHESEYAISALIECGFLSPLEE